MKFTNMVAAVVVVCLMFAVAAQAQEVSRQSASAPVAASETKPAASETIIPRLIKFSGTLLDEQRQALKGPVGVTFSLYAQQTGGAALWMETQNVKPDENGNYMVLLGANSAKGVPAELFVSGEARWLGIQVGQQPEHERILLVSVPYALKAGDAETLGGLPASAFVTTATAGNAANSAGGTATSSSTVLTPTHTQSSTTKATSTPQPAAACTGVTSDGSAKVNSIALFTTACNVQGSLMSQATINGFPGINLAGNNAGLLLNGTGTHQVTVTGATSGRLGQDANGFFFASDTKNASVRFLTNNGTLNEWMRITSVGNVGIGTTTPAAKLDIAGNLNLPTTTSATMGVLTLGGTPFLHNFGNANTFVGASAGNTSASLMGGANTGVGSSALNSNTTGSNNNAFGFHALASNTTGADNDAFGERALNSNTTGTDNDAFGFQALNSNTMGTDNNAFGFQALANLGTGDANIAIGPSAGINLTSGSSNIYVGSGGPSIPGGESNTIRIGGSNQTAAFMAGISGATSASGVAVLVNSFGQLGTVKSSRRFKDEIADMGGESDLLMKLRPVAFYYKPELDETHTRQYGLVAEEVAQVAPQLVVFDQDGAPDTVRYHFVNAMLLNEVQKQQRQIEVQERQIQAQQKQLQAQATQLAEVKARLEELQAKPTYRKSSGRQQRQAAAVQ